MKYVALVARILLGLMFVFSGSISAFNLIKAPPPTPDVAGQFTSAMQASHYLVPIGAVMLAGGLLLVIGRFVPLGLVLLGPILVNILIYHITMAPKSIGPGLVCTLLWFLVFWYVRSAFMPIFQAKVQQAGVEQAKV